MVTKAEVGRDKLQTGIVLREERKQEYSCVVGKANF